MIFTRYHRQGIPFTHVEQVRSLAGQLNVRLINMLARQDVDSLFFMGRVAFGPPPRARSTRRPLDQLVLTS